jgi:hypothetical protein
MWDNISVCVNVAVCDRLYWLANKQHYWNLHVKCRSNIKNNPHQTNFKMLNVEFSFFDIYTTIVLMNPEYLFVCLIEYGQKIYFK